MINRTVPYSILELASVPAGVSAREVFSRAVDLARHAEKWGYTRFWLAEHHNMISIASSATSVLIGHVAGGTTTIRVGSGGIMLPNHSPLLVAEQFATLATLYPGRIDLGLGRAPGTDQLTAHAIRPDRMQSVYRFPEEVDELLSYFSPENIDSRVRVPIAEGVDVPVYILGSSTDSAHVAAMLGLPYAFASHFAPGQLLEALDIYRSTFKPSQYLSAPYTIACVNVIAADTQEEAELLSTTMVRMAVGIMTNKIEYLQPPRALSRELLQLLQEPAFQQRFRYAFIGDKETVQPKVASFLEQTGVDELMIVSHLYDHAARLRSFELVAEMFA